MAEKPTYEELVGTNGYEYAGTQSKLSAIPNTDFLNKISLPEEIKKIIDKYQK